MDCHKKYVHRICAGKSENGFYIVTASHDRSVCVLEFKNADSSLVELDVIQFDAIPECVTFKNADVILIGVRDSNYIRYVNLANDAPYLVEKINVNEMNDDYVSYNMLDIAVCPRDERIIGTKRMILYCL